VSASPESAERIDLKIWFQEVPSWLEGQLGLPQTLRYTSPYVDADGQPGLVIWLLAGAAFYRLSYPEGIDYILSSDGANLWVRWSGGARDRDVFSYLLGPVMGLALRLRGLVCLHASAIELERQAVVFIGEAGAGKSTTAMALGCLGFSIMSDDIVPIWNNGGVIYAQPGYPRMRLRDTSLFDGLNPRLQSLSNSTHEGRLHFDLISAGCPFESAPLPIGAIYLLADRTNDASAPYVETVKPLDGILGIVANTYATRFLDKSMRAKEFHVVSRLVGQAAPRKLYPHQDPSHLAELCDVILKDIRGRGSSTQALC